jgi:Ca2+-binding protein (EF-Hand superfamily)
MKVIHCMLLLFISFCIASSIKVEATTGQDVLASLKQFQSFLEAFLKDEKQISDFSDFLFNLVDINRDGKISKEEFDKGFYSGFVLLGSSSDYAKKFQQTFKEVDLDKNGYVSKDETIQAVKVFLKKVLSATKDKIKSQSKLLMQTNAKTKFGKSMVEAKGLVNWGNWKNWMNWGNWGKQTSTKKKNWIDLNDFCQDLRVFWAGWWANANVNFDIDNAAGRLDFLMTLFNYVINDMV